MNTSSKGQRNNEVLVAISGGVDSAVTAKLLVDLGYRVTGVFIDIWQPDFTDCTAGVDRRDAMRVAASLGIDFQTLDCREEYRAMVVDRMIEAYRRGETPNPDVWCNSFIKFGRLFRYAVDRGAQAVATGHYARVLADRGPECLARGLDHQKDQSYFLWGIDRSVLAWLIFPVGELEKSQVRTLAERSLLPVATKPDSQGVCFLGPVEMRSFLAHYIAAQPGPVVDSTGAVIGDHDGVWFYTLGQRHGFRIKQKPPDSPPLYIVRREIETNRLTVSPNPQDGAVWTVQLREVNFLAEFDQTREYLVQVRYRGDTRRCKLSRFKNSSVQLDLIDRPAVMAGGQSAVIYDGDICLGGGVIERSA